MKHRSMAFALAFALALPLVNLSAQAIAPRNIVNGTYVGDSVLISGNGEPSALKCSPMLLTCNYLTGGQAPAFFAMDGQGSMWASNQNSNNVSKIAPNGTVSGPYPVGSVPAGLLFLNGNIWVANWNGASVTVLKASTGQLVKTISLPSGSEPYQLVFAKATGTVFATNENGSLLEINPESGHITSIPIGGSPYQAVIQGSYLWMTILTGQLARVNVKSGAVNFYSVPGTSDLTGITAVGSYLWLMDFSTGNLIEFNPTASEVVATVSTGVQIGQTVYYAFGSLWVSGLGTDAIIRVNPKTLVAQTVPLPAGYLDQPLGIASLGKTLWVANNGPQGLGVTTFTP